MHIKPLAFTWLGLTLLTLGSVALGEWMHGMSGLPIMVAAIVWLKAWLVARYYLEVRLSRRFIRWLVWVFIAFAPLALVFTDLFGQRFAAWAQL